MNTSEQAAAPSAADSPSIEQRIGSIFGGDPIPKAPPPREPAQPRAEAPADPQSDPTDQAPAIEETASETPEESTAPDYAEVEFEGRQYQVPPELKEAIIRHADYTKKTQEVSEQRKLVEHQSQQLRAAQMNQAFQTSIQPQLAEIAQIDQQLDAYGKVNWREVPSEDRSLHLLEMQRLEKLKATRQQEINAKQGEHHQKFSEHLSKLQADASALLKSRVPNWNDATAKEVRDWAIGNGFTQEEVSSIYDPRHAEVLWKAAQYDKARSTAKPSITQAKALKPSSANPMPPQTKEYLNFRKQVSKTAPGSAERKAAVEGRVGDIFQKR